MRLTDSRVTVQLALLLGSTVLLHAIQGPIWGPLRADGCRADGIRQFSAQLHGAPDTTDWRQVCATLPANVMGHDRTPSRCELDRRWWLLSADKRGRWDVPDASCRLEPDTPPTRGEEGDLSATAPMEGYADLHVHQMAHLGFGGSVIWGGAYGDPATLGPIPKAYRRGHDAVEEAVNGSAFKSLFTVWLGDLFKHGERGAPDYRDWPAHDLWTHQQVYQDWLERAYVGGLRLVVMLAVNSEDMFGRGENSLPVVGGLAFQKAMAPGRTGNDMEALEWQVAAAYEMQRYVDAHAGGWYRIVRDPDEAAQVIADGKLAVVLGTELQHLFNCDVDRPVCTPETIVEGLNRLEAMGVNYVFPVHHKLNQFGGPAAFQPLNTGPTENCQDLSYPCTSVGLSVLGRFLVEELTARGMLIDTEHLSRRAFADTMAIAEDRGYPVLAGHVEPLDLQGSRRTERSRSSHELSRVLAVGGMVAPIMSTTAHEYPAGPTSPAQVAIRCRAKYGGVDRWANAYLLLRDLAATAASTQAPRIAFGTDFNGFAGWPGPRHDVDESCEPTKIRGGGRLTKEAAVAYPIDLPRLLVRAATNGADTLGLFVWPPGGRDWNYNAVGVAHVGMLPDFVENLRLLGLTLADLEPLYRSARSVVDLWAEARNTVVPDDRHHVRWAPQSPFDVLPFTYWDAARNVEAHTGFPICRSRRERTLGFLRNDACESVEPARAGPPAAATPIEAYHSGRCLDVDRGTLDDRARVVQAACGTQSHQRWYVRRLPSGDAEIVNAGSGKCLTAGGGPVRTGARAIQLACTGLRQQAWTLVRVGNTFQLVTGGAGLCLEVHEQSRRDGADVKAAPCTGASHQQWTIESERANDFERLYQADMLQVHWQPLPSVAFPVAVTVDGVREICRSSGAPGWLGVVLGSDCSGRTYSGSPVTTRQFDRLFQAR